ncbi:RRP15-like protein [Brachyhypopomus gauderio]|uniref:RRP15-like protein n=1 Tax=Brachyhypopomus gauderio TaxID=698409 RepID=UPI004041D05B
MASLVKKPHVVVEIEKEDIGVNEEEGSDDDLSGGPEEDRSENDGDEAEDEEEQNGDVEEANPNAGWAEAMAKILGKKTPDNKPCILLKNKRFEKLSAKEKKEKLERKKQADKKRAWELMCRVKPDVVQDKEKERTLQRTATRGVVQLFNAVRTHQKSMNEKMKEVGGSERKKAKLLSSVSKKDFIDVLRGTSAGRTRADKTKQLMAREPKEEKPAWSVLRDDFMMGASMKDWDKESDADPEGEGPPEPAGDMSSDSD